MTKPKNRSSKKRRKKPKTITRSEAVNRLDAMVSMIEEDVKIGLWAEATLVSANDIVTAIPAPKMPGAAYSMIAQSLAVNLALSLSRLYDKGAKRVHPNRKDVASIPLIVRLLKQKRCQDALGSRARDWITGERFAEINERACRRSIASSIAAYEGLSRSPAGQEAIRRLRLFRNKQLAHSLMNQMIKALPTYDQLFLMMDVARDVIENAKLAIDGENMDLKESEVIYRDFADDFWNMAFGGDWHD